MTALTIGKFESIHRGHQLLINEMISCAKENNLTSLILTFKPHPRVALGESDYCPLFTYDERAYIISKMQADRFFAYPFDVDFISQEPETFCLRMFQDFDVRFIVLGEGYRFGKNRTGTIETLKELASAQGIAVRIMPHLSDGEGKISTSDIRTQLAAGLLPEANELLGFEFFIMGTVAHGKKIGTRLGFPTVNIIPPRDKFLPPDGVYATCTYVNGMAYKSVTNVGLCPSFHGINRTVETNVLDFNGNLYGEALRIDFLRFLRPERRFNTIDALREQITKDVASARV